MIHLSNTRFGDISVEESSAITFPRGIIGFSEEVRFTLLERTNGPIAYLQSLRNPRLALPIIDASLLAPTYPDGPREELANLVGIETSNMVVLVVVHVSPEDKRLRANLLAPIVVDVENRKAWQVILDPDTYGANVPIGDARPTTSAATNKTTTTPAATTTSATP
ncbi:MAG: flagellar assembly protein FliW [Myxococcales bacterium]|nr:flagellar assembly protein FliW [Myxococcales bacterium]